ISLSTSFQSTVTSFGPESGNLVLSTLPTMVQLNMNLLLNVLRKHAPVAMNHEARCAERDSSAPPRLFAQKNLSPLNRQLSGYQYAAAWRGRPSSAPVP